MIIFAPVGPNNIPKGNPSKAPKTPPPSGSKAKYSSEITVPYSPITPPPKLLNRYIAEDKNRTKSATSTDFVIMVFENLSCENT